MEKTLYSGSWYRVADLRPRLRAHARIHRYHFRGEPWYVLQDRTSGRFHRFRPAAYLVISLLDGERSVQQAWDAACEQLGDDVLTQDDMIRLLAQLHNANVLQGDVPPDVTELTERTEKMRRRKLMMSLINPMAVRIPLLDPDEFLRATYPAVRPVFTIWGLLVFLAVVGYGLLLAGQHWAPLTENIADRVLATESLLLMLLTFPLVKALHELGHAYALKRWGAEVHEIGLMFLVFVPIPYVDASDAASFHEKWRRVVVSAAGIMVELFLAALAMFVWVGSEEGLLRAFAFNVMLIGGVSTVLFNGNPLLRFDGYYMFSDFIEIPNLAQRSNRYIGYLIQRYLFRVEGVESPATTAGERRWMFFYAIASFLYRMVIVVTIVLFVASKFFVVGVLMAIWACVLMLLLPLAKLVVFLFTGPALRRVRGRAFAATAATLAALALLIGALPLPFSTVTEGVVWTADEGVVHAGADGVAAEVLVPIAGAVVPGTPLIRLEDPMLDAEVQVLKSRQGELQQRYTALDLADPIEARIVQEQLRHTEADLRLARERRDSLLVRSPLAGRFVTTRAADIPGQFFAKGAVLGYVTQDGQQVIRVIVPEDRADLVRERVERVEVRLAERMAEVFPARVIRAVPALSNELPSMALSTQGGGEIIMDPTGQDSMRALSNLLHLELQPTAALPAAALGERVYVRFRHGYEPLIGRMFRAVRQVFLRQFNV